VFHRYYDENVTGPQFVTDPDRLHGAANGRVLPDPWRRSSFGETADRS
jgi:hypothetical protein